VNIFEEQEIFFDCELLALPQFLFLVILIEFLASGSWNGVVQGCGHLFPFKVVLLTQLDNL